MTKLILIDDHPIVLAGLVDILTSQGKYEIVATGATADAALHLVRTHDCDVLVADLNLPGDMVETIRQIRIDRPSVRILAFTANGNVECCMQLLAAGATGYVLKGSSGGDLFYALEEVAAGKEYVSSAMATKMVREMRQAQQRKAERASVALNAREDQVVRELMSGASNKEIATKLNLSDKTVKHYMTQIMQKYNARNRVEVILEAQRLSGHQMRQ
ncbi:response regulator transcription factor [Rhodobacter sp. HX-7-19]|uniref:Response regulator transcription factor n=1 Tax=Paragemmobacter kunshanensis TaxID=2583234 RepID=A0A6M1U631_9RHOB|nr:response regulator transcription factor [Rhodobacter kunshanensis]NGQ91745.1 response regulator transcription factor [Rhodobacter kunshanensis]